MSRCRGRAARRLLTVAATTAIAWIVAPVPPRAQQGSPVTLSVGQLLFIDTGIGGAPEWSLTAYGGVGA